MAEPEQVQLPEEDDDDAEEEVVSVLPGNVYDDISYMTPEWCNAIIPELEAGIAYQTIILNTYRRSGNLIHKKFPDLGDAGEINGRTVLDETGLSEQEGFPHNSRWVSKPQEWHKVGKRNEKVAAEARLAKTIDGARTRQGICRSQQNGAANRLNVYRLLLNAVWARHHAQPKYSRYVQTVRWGETNGNKGTTSADDQDKKAWKEASKRWEEYCVKLANGSTRRPIMGAHYRSNGDVAAPVALDPVDEEELPALGSED